MTAGGVRIAAGELKGRRLKIPPDVRPTSQRVREAIFSHWQNRIVGCAFLDLFAGSGAMALEAASRGAARILCVEARLVVGRALREVSRDLANGGIEVRIARLPEGMTSADLEPFDLVFADPPYDFEAYEALLDLVGSLLTRDGEAAVEHSVRTGIPAHAGDLERVAVKRYGESCVSYYRCGGESS